MVGVVLGLLILCFSSVHAYKTDIVLIGPVHKARSISQHVTSFANCLEPSANIWIISSSWSNHENYSEKFLSKLITPQKLINVNPQIVIFTDQLNGNDFRHSLSHKFTGLRIIFAWTDYSTISNDMVNDIAD